MRNRLIIVTAMLSVLTSCTQQQQSPDQIRERAATATAELKTGAKAVAEGVREGWNRDRPIDLNKASREQLATLPGISPERADRIIAARPYDSTQQLVSRHLLMPKQYDAIKSLITVRN